MFRIKNNRGTTVNKASHFSPAIPQPQGLAVIRNNIPAPLKPIPKVPKLETISKLNNAPIIKANIVNKQIKISDGKLKLNTNTQKSGKNSVNLNHNLKRNVMLRPSNKMKPSKALVAQSKNITNTNSNSTNSLNSEQKPIPTKIEQNPPKFEVQNKQQVIEHSKKQLQEKRKQKSAGHIVVKAAQKANDDKNPKQIQQLRQKQQQENMTRKKQEERIRKKVQEEEDQRRRQQQSKQIIARIRQRQRRRQLEKQAQQRRKEEQQTENLNQNEDYGGMMYSNDPLAHFQFADRIMDAQINKILKTSFLQFPSGATIEQLKDSLERINSSYNATKFESDHERLNEGLKNYRIELFNKIGELIVKDQMSGYRHPHFPVIQHNSKETKVNENVQVTRGLPKNKINQIITIKVADTSEECGICLQNIKIGEQYHQLPCSHKFHINCSGEWVENTANCPMCRKNLKR